MSVEHSDGVRQVRWATKKLNLSDLAPIPIKKTEPKGSVEVGIPESAIETSRQRGTRLHFARSPKSL